MPPPQSPEEQGVARHRTQIYNGEHPNKVNACLRIEDSAAVTKRI